MTWKQDHANESEKALRHPLVQEVIEEFLGNIQRNDALTRYGVSKIGSYVAQVARAQALGIDPEMLRMDDDEIAKHMMKVMQVASDAGKPVIVVTHDPDDDQ